MANLNKPGGFAPVRNLNGAKWTGQGNIYYIASSDTNAYYPGDPVTLASAGSAGGLPGITRATAGSAMVGVLIAVGVNSQGSYYDPNNLALTSAPATKTKAYYALVVDDPNVIFEAQELDLSGSVLAASNIGQNLNFVYAAPASTAVAVSGAGLDNTTIANTATLNFKLWKLAQRIDNAIGQYAKWEVLINNHIYKGGTGTAGV
jgi:hypothetical protein